MSTTTKAPRRPALTDNVIFWARPSGSQNLEPRLASIWKIADGNALDLNIHEAGILLFARAVPYSPTPLLGHWCFTDDME